MRWTLWPVEAKELSAEFWTYFTSAMCFDIGFAMYLFLYSLYLLDLGYNERQLGLIAGAMTVGAMVGTLPAGYLADRFGAGKLLVASFLLTPGVGAARLFTPGESAQIVFAVLTGIAVAQWQVCFSPVTAALTSKRSRTFAFSLMFSTGIASGAAAGLLGGWLPGWLQTLHPALTSPDAKRIVLLLCCAIHVIGAWPAARLHLNRTREEPSRRWRFDPFLYRYLPAIALWSLAAGAFVPFAQVYLAREVHLPLARIGQAFSAGQIAQVIAVLLAPVLFRRCGLATGIAYTQGLSGIILAGLARSHGASQAVSLYVAFLAVHWMSGPGIYSLLMGRVEEGARSTASAANNFTTSLCQAVASPIAGAAFLHFGYPLTLTAIAVVAVSSSVLFRALLGENAAEDQCSTVSAIARI